MQNYDAKDVASYIASADKAARRKLTELRELITSTIPDTEEKIGWGVPIYKYHGVLAGFVALKNHVNFGLVTVLQSDDRDALKEKGYKTGKKTVQIKFDQKVPTTAIKRILKAQAKANKTKKTKT